MAIQSPFFGNNKRDTESTTGLRPTGMQQARGLSSPNAVMPGSATAPATPQENPAVSHGTTAGTNTSAAPGTGFSSSASDTPEGGSRLTVGPNIKLKGVEITDCDTLFVEGMVEATMDSRLMQIAEGGSFKGSADIDLAEIRGDFDGNLTVREKLVIHATGRVTGTVRYGKLVVEEGGQMSGDIQFGSTTAKSQIRSAAGGTGSSHSTSSNVNVNASKVVQTA